MTVEVLMGASPWPRIDVHPVILIDLSLFLASIYFRIVLICPSFNFMVRFLSSSSKSRVSQYSSSSCSGADNIALLAVDSCPLLPNNAIASSTRDIFGR